MHQPEVLSRALNTHNYKKDVTEFGGARDKNPYSILGRAQESLFSSKTGLRRLFGGVKDDVVGPIPDDQTETLEIPESVRNVAAATAVVSTPSEEAPAVAGKMRRSSMTTYTINLGPTGTQVQREVRRLAGLMPTAFSSGPGGNEPPMVATSFDVVEEMGSSGTGAKRSYSGGAATTTAAAAAAAGMNDDSDDEEYTFRGLAGQQPTTAGGGAGTLRAMSIKTAFINAVRASQGGDGVVSPFGGRSSEDAVGAFSGPHAAATSPVPGVRGADAVPSGCSNGGYGRGSLELVDFTFGGSQGNLHLPSAALEAGRGPVPASRGGKPGSSSQLAPPPGVSVSINGPLGTAGSGGQLGLMKDRKTASRHGTVDGYSSLPGPLSPATAVGGTGGGMVVVGGGGGGGGVPQLMVTAAAGSSPTSVLRLPNLPPPSRGPSNSQLGRIPSVTSMSDSRPGSSRVLLRGPADRHVTGDVSGAAEGGGGGGRWFQQDAEDMEYMMSLMGSGGADDEVLQRLGTAGGVEGGWGAGGALMLPRLTTAEGGPQVDRATAQLQELRKVQASVDDQLARERHAIAAGRVRRASVLEDVAGQHQQPRWQVSYNPDAPVTHAKLGSVDASRRSELEKAHLTKLVKEQKAGTAGGSVASVSPVVARARRLSTIVVG